jgi:hypothetical protein
MTAMNLGPELLAAVKERTKMQMKTWKRKDNSGNAVMLDVAVLISLVLAAAIAASVLMGIVNQIWSG